MNIYKRHIIMKVLLLRKLRKRVKRKKRSCDIRPIFFNRFQSGENTLVRELKDDAIYHYKYFRMTKETFEELLFRITTRLTVGKTHSRPISKMEKLAVTLRYLATGNSQVSLAFSYRISPSSIAKILRETMKSLCAELEDECLPVPTQENWKNVEKEFAREWNFPNCCGAIDGKHIRVRAPKLSGSMNYNYKGFFSIVLLAIVDAKYRFSIVDIGASGSQSDGGILSRSAIGQSWDKNNLNLPTDKDVSGAVLPHVIVGDDAFPLRKSLLKPYPGKTLTTSRRVFNYRLSRARMVSENAFGILAARWRIFHGPIDGDLEFVKLIIKTCVILHNLLINKRDMCNITMDRIVNDEEVLGNWRDEGTTMPSIPIQGSNNYSLSASAVREKFTDYFGGAGAVSWQNNKL